MKMQTCPADSRPDVPSHCHTSSLNMPRTTLSLLSYILACSAAAQEYSLTVEKIMQEPDTYIGAWPSSPFWSEDGETLYFRWNPMGAFPDDSLYSVSRRGGEPERVAPEARRNLGPAFDGWHHGEHTYDRDFGRKVYAEDGDIYLYDRATGVRSRLTQTRSPERSPRFVPDGDAIIYAAAENLFRLELATGATRQLTDLRTGSEPGRRESEEEEGFLKTQQRRLFEYVRTRQEEEDRRKEASERDAAPGPPVYYLSGRRVEQLRIDPAERFVSFASVASPDGATRTRAMAYVTESGYAEELSARPKVGAEPSSFALLVQDLVRDTTYQVDLHQLPGAYDIAAYRRDQGVELDSAAAKRHLYAFGPYWSADGRHAVLDVRTHDNKDRWICRLDPESATLSVLDRQHDEAWLAGPGISWFGGQSVAGWLPDSRHFYFQSEATGYSHLYLVDVTSEEVTQLTSGRFEVFDPQLSRDGSTWYFSSGISSPHVRNLYSMPAFGGEPRQLTAMPGRNDAALNPREDVLAILHSEATRPPEIFLHRDQSERITHSQTQEWLSYDWREPSTVWFEASDGAHVPAHVFEPDSANGGAVLFVHGAGYLQNVHAWWSSYFREYMFHNLLTDLGYTVMQVDYRGSAGYGRDWRTAIYRHMGGRDLQDYVDASRYLNRTYGIDPERIAIYGGSYGGFLTLMALFTEGEHFGAGAALRSVTDWAHYNHTYTSNILNTPATDSLAYARSSPINFAEGLDDPLLMPHGMVDLNVQFQDIVRLVQRLIELGKEDWELAVYPVEGHGFQQPASWSDEYRRILKLIEREVGPNSRAAR